MCTKCGEPKLSEWYCWECLNKTAFSKIEREASKWQVSQTTPVETQNMLLVQLSE